MSAPSPPPLLIERTTPTILFDVAKRAHTLRQCNPGLARSGLRFEGPVTRADWEWTIRFQEKSPGIVRAKFEKLQDQEPLKTLLIEQLLSMPGDRFVTGRGKDAQAVATTILDDVAYGWRIEIGPLATGPVAPEQPPPS
jgi:hypothetical protein